MTVDRDQALVIGVDFGTPPGRARVVRVVRVADGAELGSAVHEYTHAVVDDALPTIGKKLPPEVEAAVRTLQGAQA
jgi:L-ribulokinase